MKTQVIALDKLNKFLDNIKRHRIISVIPHTYEIEFRIDSTDMQVLKSVLIIYKEI